LKTLLWEIGMEKANKKPPSATASAAKNKSGQVGGSTRGGGTTDTRGGKGRLHQEQPDVGYVRGTDATGGSQLNSREVHAKQELFIIGGAQERFYIGVCLITTKTKGKDGGGQGPSSSKKWTFLKKKKSRLGGGFEKFFSGGGAGTPR